MKQYTSPGEVHVLPDDNPISALWKAANEYPDRAALAYRDGDRFVDVTTREFADTVRAIAKGFIGLGIQPGSRICLFSSTRIEFTYVDYAIWAAGCVTVPIYETSSAEQVEWIVGNSEAVAIICEGEHAKHIYEEVAERVPDCKHMFVIDEGGLDHLKGEGEGVDPMEVDRRIAAIDHHDMATLVYTSGTTGRPKGCVLTHHNFIWDVRQVVSAAPELFTPEDSQLMFLPLAHILARVVEVGCVTTGVKMGFSTGIRNLTEELPMFQPTWVFAVPRVFEKVYNTAYQRAAEGGKGKIFERAVDTAIAYSRARQAGRVGIGVTLRHAIFDRLVYGKLRHIFGGKLRYAISGGAPLGERLGHFYNGFGVTILEGYGLTETTAAATFNRPGDIHIGTVGRPVPGASAGIADDGEVLLKGDHVFKGYWKNEAATKEVMDDDGWFHTGDLGDLDGDGFLRITGRKKEILVTAGGKNVAPAVLEDRIRAHPLVSQCMVVGDAQPFIAALVTVDPEEWPKWAESHGKMVTRLEELRDDPDFMAAVQGAIDEGNKAVSKAEQIKAFRVLASDFTIEGGEITPTLKLKRNVVMSKYAGVVAEIYEK